MKETVELLCVLMGALVWSALIVAVAVTAATEARAAVRSAREGREARRVFAEYGAMRASFNPDRELESLMYPGASRMEGRATPIHRVTTPKRRAPLRLASDNGALINPASGGSNDVN